MAFLPIPDHVYQKVTDIDPEELRSRGIRLLLADLDNTLTRYHQENPDPEIMVWRKRLQNAGIELFLLSNSRRPHRVGHYEQVLEIPVLGHANKPSRKGYRAAMERMGYTLSETAMVGDQIFTDILGAKRSGVLALLVEPMELSGNFGRYLRYAAETPFRAAGKRKE